MSTLKEIKYHLKQSYHKKKSYPLPYTTPNLSHTLPYHTYDLSRPGVNLPIWRLPLCPPDEAAKIPIFMNSDFFAFAKS